MPWTIQVACAFVLFVSNTFAQVYHYETGKVIPVSRPGQIIWKEGVFQNFLADYGTLVVLENPKNPKSKLINIPVIKVKCLQPDSVKEPHFVLHGGPGESNIQTTLLFSGMLQKHDVILVGYRGVDGSVSLQEPHYQSALTCDSLSLKNQKIVFAKAAHEAIRFFNEKKIEWEGFGLESVVDDIEEFRKNEGYPKISFLAFSYGTMIAQLYSETYPQNMETNIYIGARPLGNFWLSDSLFHEQLYQLFKKYKQQKNEADTSWSDFSRLMAPALDTHHLAAADINPVLFDLFFFSQCYSFDNALQLFATLDKVPSKGYNKLVQKYKEFYKNYPNLVLGDLLVKKKKWYPHGYEKESIGNYECSRIIETLNNWYSPQIDYFLPSGTSGNRTIDSILTYFIFGEFDVASPYKLFEPLILSNYIKAEVAIVPDCSHLDLFYTKKELLTIRILDIINQ
ncbi:MAG TPA: hypothetical protein DCQ26_00050 [Marinilabiliales bacterium]|nr:MAG: hypothetical protein A2W95_03550 [Bacteroidetes bacterium GWA2_40_14]OFX61189.1 MAG: hypothetical protein A2W84_00505 [Bacteroidetes bacterium GWC2_40_13]OFX75277.1 MAG: hypothetical protein A2W96_16920 [Bacteroidetes bacterium GWD2_40_43]OFX89874.1 MAG: hypothetical protein A2W97_12580 [Bacteroidetes bacterium GWE2_40_63]OFY17790.1 MAG: hypothetical protein A2W88_01340 [Bacteroidetes bacterium GWF2_40_13]OFZ30280.1 MAG: hypothetical protein A2437_09715 [Bacteroidetes bacterium RIFOXYC